ncbi:phosphoribosyltransferase [Sorangium sp. So ce233]|uniref:phosphoribosyltransferase n=1 Tax=Sorangium sp. So ce233 TaxID=3133290 RepID=UPI003F61E95D
MPFTAHFFCLYLTTTEVQWRPGDYSASQFTKAVKGRKFNGYALVPVDGAERRIYSENTQEAIDIFAKWAARVVRANVGQGNIVLVPIPSSSAVVGTPTAGTPAVMAASLAARLTPRAQVADVLRWTEAMESSSHGGTRDAQVLYEHLTVTGAVPQGGPVVLVDDVCTSKGHLRAAAARLSTLAKVQVSLAVIVGRTVNMVDEIPEDPFQMPTEEVSDFVPAPRTFLRSPR